MTRYSYLYNPFQSTPPHGGRQNAVLVIAKEEGFNPRPRMGGDGARTKISRKYQKVSIHAPAWGATFDKELDVFYIEFQSTPPHGGRRMPWFDTTTNILFQSTPPHGGRPFFASVYSPVKSFNPRPRMGGDLLRL